MGKLTLKQAARQAECYEDAMIRDDRGEDEISALTYIIRWSKNAREIVGAVKLLKILDILRTKTVHFDDGWGYAYSALHPQDAGEIEKIIFEDPRMVGDGEGQDAGL